MKMHSWPGTTNMPAKKGSFVVNFNVLQMWSRNLTSASWVFSLTWVDFSAHFPSLELTVQSSVTVWELPAIYIVWDVSFPKNSLKHMDFTYMKQESVLQPCRNLIINSFFSVLQAEQYQKKNRKMLVILILFVIVIVLIVVLISVKSH